MAVKRSRNKCDSCRKLKIKCDEAKPACEYCRHTNRQCVYNEVAPRKYSKKEKEPNQFNYQLAVKQYRFVKSKYQIYYNGIDSQYQQVPLNSITKQLNISRFEGQLLNYFHDVYLISILSSAPCQNLWIQEIPRLWHESEWLRNCIFSTSVMFIGNSCDIQRHLYELTRGKEDAYEKLLTHSNCFAADMPKLHDEINHHGYLALTNVYFIDSLNRSKDLTTKLLLGDKITSVFQAAETFFTGVLIYSILILHPNKIIPLLSFKQNEMDLISVCKGIKLNMASAFPLLYHGKYSSIFEYPRIDPYAYYVKSFPLIEILRESLNNFSVVLSKTEKEVYDDAISVLETIIHQMVDSNSTSSLPSWIFLVRDELYDYVKDDKNYFAMKLIYNYSCLCLMSRMRLNKKSSILLDFMECFKSFNYEIFGDWKEYEDSNFYILIKNNYEMTNFEMLQDFLPSKTIFSKFSSA